MKLILIRHPETLANARNLVYGHTDWEYSDIGHATADAVSVYVKKTYEKELRDSTTKIIASPLTRTKIVAEKIAEHTNLQVTIVDDIIEMNVGIFENMTVSEAETKHSTEWKQFMENSIEYQVPDGESWKEVYHRAAKFIDSLSAEKGTIFVVTHAMVIRSMLAHILKVDLENTWHFKIEPGHLIEIEYRKNFGMIHTMISFHQKTSQ